MSSVFTDPRKDLTLSREERGHSSNSRVSSAELNPCREQGRSSTEGILPIAKSKPSKMISFLTGWELPGHGNAYSDCGQWRSRGCLNVEGHTQQGLDEDHAGKVFVRRYQRTCMRAACPECYESWAGKEAGKIAHRLQHAPKQGRPIHLVVSPPIEFWIRSDYESLRRMAYVVAKQSGFRGGSCIFHHLRQNKTTKKWYFSPHFHMIGFGWIKGTKAGFEKHGWVVKNVGIRKTVVGTALYQLSHAGIHKKYHTVTWFGDLAYNNLKVPPMPEKEEVCPICGSVLEPLWYFGSEKIPDERGDFWFDPEGWMVKPSKFSTFMGDGG